MNTQAIFNKVATHLLTQNCLSADGGLCMYRGPDGLKCAVGCLIDDDHYDRTLEGVTIGSDSNGRVRRVVELSIGRELSYDEVGLLANLQWTHDRGRLEEWRVKLADIATQANLNADVVHAHPIAA